MKKFYIQKQPSSELKGGYFIIAVTDSTENFAVFCDQERAEQLVAALNLAESVPLVCAGTVAAKNLIDHIFSDKKLVNWGASFVNWDLMNKSLIAIEAGFKALPKDGE